jgi:hypothetical protein
MLRTVITNYKKNALICRRPGTLEADRCGAPRPGALIFLGPLFLKKWHFWGDFSKKSQFKSN